MPRSFITGFAVMALALSACSEDATNPTSSGSEIELASLAAADAEAVAAATRTDAARWFADLFDRLRQTDDPEAQACLAEARELRAQAHDAFEAGDREKARRLLHESFRKMLCAVIEVFPNAPERTGNAVDEIVTRISERLGDREAPRIRRVLAHVEQLRADAEAALTAGDTITALELNLRSMHLLRRLMVYMHHARDGEDTDRCTDELGAMVSG